MTAKKTAPLVRGLSSLARKSSTAAPNWSEERGSTTGALCWQIRSQMLAAVGPDCCFQLSMQLCRGRAQQVGRTGGSSGQWQAREVGDGHTGTRR